MEDMSGKNNFTGVCSGLKHDRAWSADVAKVIHCDRCGEMLLQVMYLSVLL